jgi:hypothetical protein
MDTNQDTKQAPASAPGAVLHVDVSSTKGQRAFQTTKALTDGPSYYPEDNEMLTWGHQEESVLFGKAYVGLHSQTTQVLTDGPTYYTEDNEKIASALEQDPVSPWRASVGLRGVHSESDISKKNGTAKETTDYDNDAVTIIADEKLKKIGTRSDRQENRRARIAARADGQSYGPEDNEKLTSGLEQESVIRRSRVFEMIQFLRM